MSHMYNNEELINVYVPCIQSSQSDLYINIVFDIAAYIAQLF